MPSAGFAISRHGKRRVFRPNSFPKQCLDFAPMKDLPEELLDRICSVMDRKSLCKTMHVSSSLRRVASPHLLVRLGISQSDVRGGTVKLDLSGSLNLILFVAHICPIQRLECFQHSWDMHVSELQRLALILGATAPIPDILIHDRLKEGQQRDSLVLYLLAYIPHTATDTLLIILPWTTLFSASLSIPVHVSRPRAGPPPTGIPPIYSHPQSTPPGILARGFSAILMCLRLALYNLYTIIRCVVLRVFGPGWSVQERISTDVDPIWFHGGLHLQRLPNKHTLVTYRESEASNHFRMEPLNGVSESVYSALLASLDFQFIHATVEAGRNLTLADLATFVSRQNHLHSLDCGQNSIRDLISSSSSQYHVPSKIAHLSAQASDIPHLLPLAPRVERIYLSFLSVSNRLIGPGIFNFFAYCTALEAIARLPGWHDLALSFTFNLAAAHLPWEMEASSDDPEPETQLHRVEHLMLRCTKAKQYSGYVYSSSTIRALLPWLARFPSLQRVSFDKDSVEAIRHDERLQVAAAIASVCPGMIGAGDVAFEIADDDEMRDGW